MKKFKRFFAVFVCVAVLLGSTPLGGFVGLDLPSLFGFRAAAETYNGTCGANLTWTLDTGSGELNITGTGAMSEWSTPSDVPWHTSRNSIKSVTIDSGATSIGNYAFDYCPNLERISFPGSVTSVGTSAFGCEDGFCELSDVYYTGDLASWCAIDFKDLYSNPNRCADNFYFNGSLFEGEIVIPAGVTAIKNYTFLNCENITSVTIPDGVESIGMCAFRWCEGLTNVTIPESVTSIGNSAFQYCRKLESITIPESVTSIGTWAFSDCDQLISITVPGKATTIASNTFSSCDKLSTVIIQDGITSIGGSAFSYCSALKNITIPASITDVGSNAFGACSQIKAVYYPGTLAQWGNVTVAEATSTNGYFTKNIVYECNSDRPYYTGTCGTKLTWTLDIKTGLLEISGTGSMSNWNGYGHPGWYNHRSSIKSITISEGVTSIGSYAFDFLGDFTSITIPDSVTAIGSSAFYCCKSLTNITIPSGVKTIDTYTFYNCQSLTSIIIPDSVTTISDYAFSYCDKLTDVYYGSTEEDWNKISISSGNEPLTSATIYFTEPDEPTIASGTCGDNLTWTLYESGQLSISGTGAMDDYTNSSSPWYSHKDSIKTVNIGSGITTIGDNAFYDCTVLTNVTILNSVTTIGDYAFCDCDSLTSVRIGKGVKTIKEKAFSNCHSLTTITIPDSVITIGNGAFYDCTVLTNVTIPDSVTTIEDEAFYGCISLANVTLGNGVTTIGNSAFGDCRILPSVIIPDSVTTIGNSAFSDCSGLKNVTIGNGITNIPTGMFKHTDLTSVKIPDSVTTIGDSAFSSCDNLNDVYYGSSEEDWNKISIGSDNEPLTSATIRFNKPDVPTIALGTCGDSLTWTLYKNGLLEISGTGDMANYSYNSFPWYSYRSSITAVNIASGVTSIGDYAFCYCERITTVTIPDSIKAIGDYVFVDCYDLSSVTIPDGIESIGDYAFGWYAVPYYSGTLEQWEAVETSSSDTSIDKRVIICGGTDRPYYIPGTCGTKLNWILYADGELVISGTGAMTNFSADSYTPRNNPWYAMRSNIRSVTISEGVTSIGNYAFIDCKEITKVIIPESVTNIGSCAFMYCSGIKELTMPASAKIANSYTTFSGCYSIEKLTLTAGTGVMQNYSISSSSSSYTYYQHTPWYESRARLNEIIIEDGVTSIGNNAFYEAYGAESVRIPASVTTIGNSAFKSTYGDLTDVYYNSTEEEWNKISIGSENELLTSATLHTAKASGSCGDSLDWTLYDTGRLEIIGKGAMTSWTAPNKTPWFNYRTEINEIIIGNGITTIGKYAFYSCTAQKSVTIPETVTSIDANAFGNSRNITEIHYASDKSDWDKITIGSTNNALTYAQFDYGVKRLAGYGHVGELVEWELYTDGELLVIGEGGMSNYASAEYYPWHKYRDKITSFTLETYPGGYYPEMTNIGSHALEGCVNLETVKIYSVLRTIGDYAFAGCTSLKSIVIPDTVTNIGDGAFYGCSGLNELTMPVSAKIYNSANVFYGCKGIGKVTLTKGNGTMVSYGFDTSPTSSSVYYQYTPWYISTTQIDLTIEEGITAIPSYTFHNSKSITNVTIPEGIATIGAYAFQGNIGLKNVTLPASVNTIGEYAFYGCSALENTYYNSDITNWCKISFADAYATPMCFADNLYLNGKLATEVTIPGFITSIGDYAFYGCDNITAVYYEGTPEQWNNVTIGKGNDILNDILVGGDSDNPFLAAGSCGDNIDWVLYADGELVFIGSGDMPTYLSEGAAPWYNYRNSIKKVTIPEGITSVGGYSFINCQSIESVVIPDSVTTIGTYAFYGCAGIKELSIPVSTKVSNYTFYSCNNIETITITKGNGTSIEYGSNSSDPTTFYRNTPWYVSGCSTVIIADGVKSIGKYMFYRCLSLQNVVIADSVESIGNAAFYYCTDLRELTIPVSAKIYNSTDTFLNCINIRKITLTKGNGTAQDYVISSTGLTTTYYQYTPWYKSQCRTIVVDKGITSLGCYTFYGCNNAKDVYFTGDIADWCNISFDDNTANPLHSGGNFYIGNELVKEITIPATIEKIGSYAFYNCSSFTAAYFNGTPEQWRAINVGTGNDALINMLLFNDGNRFYYAPGTCGADISWIMHTDGELVITGSGEMNVWTSAKNVPWSKYKDIISSVKIGDGVTSIGDYAFYGCLNISAVNLPDSITRIGTNAFFGCTGLTAITLSKNLTNIDKAAFSGCSSLTVARCEMTYDQWKEVTIEQGNTELTYAILLGTESDKLYFAAGNIGENITWYLYEDNELCFVGEGDMASYTAAENAPWYDRRDKIKTVVVSDGITSIGKNAFAECENITNVYIYGYDVSVANGVFDDCYDVNINCYSGSSAHAYAKRYNLAYTLFDGNTAGFTVMNGMITAYSGTETDIVIPAGITAIGSYVFMNNDTVVSIALPDTVTDIYTGAFAGCNNLERIIIPESVTTIASTAFNDTDVIFACSENSYAHVYATEHGITCELTNPVTGIELTSHSEYISVNGKVQLSVTFAPDKSQNKSVIWSSSDSTVASVDENGLVTGKKAGSVVITVTAVDGGYKDFCLIRVVGITASLDSNTVIDPGNGFIYGLDAGLDSIEDYINLTDNSCTLEYDTLSGEIGTGSITNIVRDGEIVDSYTVIIFGDIDGNGWYDANDAFLVHMIASGLVEKDRLGEAVWRAADCNHDGLVNELDFEILNNASVLLDSIDQSATQAELETNAIYIEYMSLIDQSAGVEIEQIPKESAPESNEPAEENYIAAVFAFLSDIISKILAFIISFIVV